MAFYRKWERLISPKTARVCIARWRNWGKKVDTTTIEGKVETLAASTSPVSPGYVRKLWINSSGGKDILLWVHTSLCCGLGVFSIFLCRGCFWIAGSFFLSVGRNALLTRAWRLCWAGRACVGSPQNTKACVAVNNWDMLKSVLWCWRAQHTGNSDQGGSLGGRHRPVPSAPLVASSASLQGPGTQGFRWTLCLGRGQGAVGAGASGSHVFQLSALFLFSAAFPWSSESGEAGREGEEGGERAEEKGNRVENGKMGERLGHWGISRKQKKKKTLLWYCYK